MIMPENINSQSTIFIIYLGIILLLFLFFFLFFFLYLRERQKNRRLTQLINRSWTEPLREKSYGIIRRAIRKAQAILGNAELASIKIVAESKIEGRKFNKKFDAELADLKDELERQLTDQTSQASREFISYLQNLRLHSQQFETANQKFITQRATEVIERLEGNLDSFLKTTIEKANQTTEVELKATQDLIASYRNRQLAIIDENIVSILETTLAKVLPKQVSLQDQMDLIYEALEKAKAEKMIGSSENR